MRQDPGGATAAVAVGAFTSRGLSASLWLVPPDAVVVAGAMEVAGDVHLCKDSGTCAGVVSGWR